MSRSGRRIPASAPRLCSQKACRAKMWRIDWLRKPEFHETARIGWLASYEATVFCSVIDPSDRPAVRPSGRLSHHRPPPLRRRRRLVRQSLELAEFADRAARADDAARRRSRARRDAHGARAVGRPLHLYDRPRERAFLRRRDPEPAALSGAGWLSARRRQLRNEHLVPARDRARLSGPSAG